MNVFKYPLKLVDGQQKVEMPDGAVVLYAAMQHGLPTLWAAVDTTRNPRVRVFWVVGTGWAVSELWSHVGSMLDGTFVWHVFEDRMSA